MFPYLGIGENLFLGAPKSLQMVKNLPAMQETPGSGKSPGEGNFKPLQYSRRIPWTEESGGL